MNNYNNTLRNENFWISLIWLVIFMLVLVWDQEKIVVLNLILFCYFLYYLVGDTIYNTLNQRRQMLLEILSNDLDTQLNILKTLVEEAKISINLYRTLLLVIVKKLFIRINNLLLNLTISSSVPRFNIFTFMTVLLQRELNIVSTKDLHQNLFVASQTFFDVNPTFTDADASLSE